MSGSNTVEPDLTMQLFKTFTTIICLLSLTAIAVSAVPVSEADPDYCYDCWEAGDLGTVGNIPGLWLMYSMIREALRTWRDATYYQ